VSPAKLKTTFFSFVFLAFLGFFLGLGYLSFLLFRFFRTSLKKSDFLLPDTFVSEVAVDRLGYIVWSKLKISVNVFLLAERCYLWKRNKTYILIHEFMDYLVDFWIVFFKYLELLSEESWFSTDLYCVCL